MIISTQPRPIEDDTRAESAICRYPTNQLAPRVLFSPPPLWLERGWQLGTIFFPILSSIERDPTIGLTINLDTTR